MKILLEFEEPDLRDMIQSHFEKNGFSVRNLDEICAQFNAAFPEGLKVYADMLPIEAVTPVRTTHRAESTDADEDDVPYVPPVDENPRLALSDLMDPTPRPVHGRMELTRDSKTADKDESIDLDIKRLVNQSRRLEQVKD